MEDKPVVMVQVAEPEWTGRVLHAACRLGRSCGAEIALVYLLRVPHLRYLGSSLGYADISEEDMHSLQAYADTAEDYGLPCSLTLYQYCDLYAAIVDAADLVDADIVFAKLPKSAIPFWSDCQFEMLRVRLSHRHVELFNEPGIWGKPLPTAAAEPRFADVHA